VGWNKIWEAIKMRFGFVIARKKDILIAKSCLNFKGFYCYNQNCNNTACPLNKKWVDLSEKEV